jgi:hypothetical protein
MGLPIIAGVLTASLLSVTPVHHASLPTTTTSQQQHYQKPATHAALPVVQSQGHYEHAQVKQTAVASKPPAVSSPATWSMYDSTTPSQIPSGMPVATYATGPYAVQGSKVPANTVWIDTTGTDPHATALDVEPGDNTPASAAVWAKEKLSMSGHGLAVIYTTKSEWGPTEQSVGSTLTRGQLSRVRWWIADPTGVPHLLPGSSATQWQWGSGYDISMVRAGF